MAGRAAGGALGRGLSIEAAHYYARIYGSARAGCLAELRRLGCKEEEAEDIFAATLERIMRKFDPTDSPYTQAQMIALLKKACRQKLIDERRHRDVLKLVPLESASQRHDQAAESPAEAAEAREVAAMGREAIASLPDRDRALFFQRHRLNLTPEEILERNPGLSRRTYRKVIQRANARALEVFKEIDSGSRCERMRHEHLRRYVASEANGQEEAMVQAHLRHCRVCQLEAMRMRNHLHDLAAGLAAVIGGDWARAGLFADLSSRMLDAALQGGDGLGAATRAARERLRELMLRAAMTLSGSGGETAAGQLVGVSAVKAVAVCGAGAIAVGCLATGMMPGLGVLDKRIDADRNAPETKVSRELSIPAEVTSTPDAHTTSRSTSASTTGRARKNIMQSRITSSTLSRDSAESSGSSPTVSGRQTGTELGSESKGTGAPVSLKPARPSSGAGTSNRAGGVSTSPSGSSQGAPGATGEFGF